MSVEKQDKDTPVSAEAGVGEMLSAETPGEVQDAETEIPVQMPEEVAEASTEMENVETDVRKVNLKALARDLYQTGLALGLTPDEAALLMSEMELGSVQQRRE